MRRLADLPIRPGFAPMEARLVDALPEEPGWRFEPKWDGFRRLAFRAEDEGFTGRARRAQPPED